MKNKIIKFFDNKKTVSYIIVILASICICIPLFFKNIDISRDDGIQHICRIIGTHQSIKQTGLFNPIMSNFCNGFGYGWNIFYSPLTAYLPLIFKLIVKSYVLTLKLFMFSTILLSGIFMYKLVYSISKSYKASIISSVIYMCTPYHLTDLYNRIAIAELASFMFLPILFIGIYDLFYKKGKKSYYISIGATGLIISHNVIAVFTAIFCLIYVLLHYRKLQNKDIIKKLVLNFIVIILATSFYWIPLLQHYFASTYEVFVPGRMFQNNTLISSKLSLLDLFFTKHFGMIFHIGLPTIIGITLLALYRKKVSIKYKKTLVIFLIFGLVSIVMTLKIFPFEHFPNFLKMIQFGWRMLEFSSFFLSIVAGIGIAMFLNSKLKKSLKILITVILVIYTIILLKDSIFTVEIPFNEENYITPVPVTNLTGRIHAGLASFEYLPKKAFENRSYIEERPNDVVVLSGNANISDIKKENTNLTFKIENVTENTELELPYIYYLGYNAKIINENGSMQTLKIEESNKGFCKIKVSNIKIAQIEIKYAGTFLMKVSYIITLITAIAFVLYTQRKNIKFILHQLTIQSK